LGGHVPLIPPQSPPLPSAGGGSVRAKISGGRGHPPENILIPLEWQLIALQLCR